MKEASGELSMTLVTIIAVAGIAILVTAFLPRISALINERFNKTNVNLNL